MAFRPGHPTVVAAQAQHTATCIFLHGLGGSGSNVAPIARSLNLPHIKFVFPTAPNRPVSINGGASMPAWFDLRDLARLMEGYVDDEGVRASSAYLGSLVQQEVAAGVPRERICVGGFSQGGHVAAKWALTVDHPPPACLMLSSWLGRYEAQVPPANRRVRFWLGHGEADPLIAFPVAHKTRELLQSNGVEATLRGYPGVGHATCAQELDDLRDFLLQLLPAQAPKPPTAEEVEAMSVRQLRELLQRRGVSTRGFLEKSEFVAAAKQLL